MNNENGENRIPSYARRSETLVAFTSAKTLSPGIRVISLTERVVMIDAISPMLVSTITSLVTLSDTMLFTVPGSWFRMLCSIRAKIAPMERDVSWAAVAHEAAVDASGYSEDAQSSFKNVRVTRKAP